MRSTEGLSEVAGGCERRPLRLCRGWEDGAAPDGHWPGHQDFTGLTGCRQGSWGSDAGPQSWGGLEKLSKYLLSVPSMGGRELLGLRAFISGALAFSLVGASRTEQGTTSVSWLLPKGTSRGGISRKPPPRPR